MNDQSGSGGGYQPPQNDDVLPDVFEVRISGNRDTFTRLRQQFELDTGCRGTHVETSADGTNSLLAYANEAQIKELRAANYKVEQGENVSELGRQRQKEVGQGDRFEGGRVAPRGLGKKTGGRKGETAS